MLLYHNKYDKEQHSNDVRLLLYFNKDKIRKWKVNPNNNNNNEWIHELKRLNKRFFLSWPQVSVIHNLKKVNGINIDYRKHWKRWICGLMCKLIIVWWKMDYGCVCQQKLTYVLWCCCLCMSHWELLAPSAASFSNCLLPLPAKKEEKTSLKCATSHTPNMNYRPTEPNNVTAILPNNKPAAKIILTLYHLLSTSTSWIAFRVTEMEISSSAVVMAECLVVTKMLTETLNGGMHIHNPYQNDNCCNCARSLVCNQMCKNRSG